MLMLKVQVLMLKGDPEKETLVLCKTLVTMQINTFR